MAISVKDIQEKEFSTVSNGYDMEQVDDFLDELAEQLGTLIRENLALNGQITELQASLSEAQAANAEMEKKLPDYNEEAYFKNLESAMRESLIGAQRIADETVTEASKKAQQTIDDANAQAEKTVAEANAQAEKTVADAEASANSITETAQQIVDELNAETKRLRSVVDAYKTSFRKLVEEQLTVLNNSEA